MQRCEFGLLLQSIIGGVDARCDDGYQTDDYDGVNLPEWAPLLAPMPLLLLLVGVGVSVSVLAPAPAVVIVNRAGASSITYSCSNLGSRSLMASFGSYHLL